MTSLLFTIGKFLIGLYLGKSDVGLAYGAAGSLIVVLLWVYYSSQIFLFGAEFTAVYATSHGSRLKAAKNAMPAHEGAVAVPGGTPLLGQGRVRPKSIGYAMNSIEPEHAGGRECPTVSA